MSKSDQDSLAEAQQQIAAMKKEFDELKQRNPAPSRFSTLDNIPWPMALLGAATIAAVAVFAVRGRPLTSTQGPSTESAAPAPAPGEYNPPPQAGPPPTPTPPSPTPDPPAPTPGNGLGPPPSAIADAIRAIYPATTACVSGTHPNIGVGFDFVSSGSVGDVRITGAVTEAQRACILSAVRGAHVPPFLAERFPAEFAF